MNDHVLNGEVVKRLKRAHGHLSKVVEMIESNSDCMKVAQQLQAVSNAIINAKKTYIHDHVEHCLSMAKFSKSEINKITEFKEITRYL